MMWVQRNRCNEKQTHRGESTNDATKHYVFHIPSCSVEVGLQCSRRLTGGLCSGLIPRSPTNVRRLALALLLYLLLPVASHPPPEHRLLLRCGRRFGTYRGANHSLVV